MLAVRHGDVVQVVLTDAQDVPEAEITLIEYGSLLKMEDGNFWLYVVVGRLMREGDRGH